jgi:HEAT repeat protein
MARAAAESLAALTADHVGPAVFLLTQALTDSDAGVQRRAARALGLLGPRAAAATDALVAALRGSRWTVRDAAALALGRVGAGSGAARDALLHVALRDPAPLARDAAATSLAAVSPSTPDVLYGTLEHPHARLRCRALRALARFAARDAGVVPAVSRALNDGHGKVRRTAAGVLGPLGAAARLAVPDLLRRHNDRDPRVAEAADAALAEVRRFAPPWDWVVLLAEPGGDAEPILVDVLRHPDFLRRLRQAFIEVCCRRARWHLRRMTRAETPAAPSEPTTSRLAAEEALVAAESAAGPRRGGREAARRREAAWLLAWLAERLLAEPHAAPTFRAP